MIEECACNLQLANIYFQQEKSVLTITNIGSQKLQKSPTAYQQN